MWYILAWNIKPLKGFKETPNNKKRDSSLSWWSDRLSPRTCHQCWATSVQISISYETITKVGKGKIKRNRLLSVYVSRGTQCLDLYYFFFFYSMERRLKKKVPPTFSSSFDVFDEAGHMDENGCGGCIWVWEGFEAYSREFLDFLVIAYLKFTTFSDVRGTARRTNNEHSMLKRGETSYKRGQRS